MISSIRYTYIGSFDENIVLYGLTIYIKINITSSTKTSAKHLMPSTWNSAISYIFQVGILLDIIIYTYYYNVERNWGEKRVKKIEREQQRPCLYFIRAYYPWTWWHNILIWIMIMMHFSYKPFFQPFHSFWHTECVLSKQK